MNKELMLKMINQHNLMLTESSIKRLTELAEIESNWDGHGAMPMNEDSCLSMLNFLKEVNDNMPEDIGFFFNYEGNTSINWVLNGKIVDISFEPEATYLYMQGYDDGIALPKKVMKQFQYNNPEQCIAKYKDKLEAVSSILYKLDKHIALRIVELIGFDYGWGEHFDEQELNIESLHSFIYFIECLEEIPEKIILFLTANGDIEAVLTEYNPRHEIEFDPEGLTFFIAPEYESKEIKRNKFNEYKEINDFLIGEEK